MSNFDDINGAYFAILVLDNQSSITFIILNDNSTQDVLPKSIFLRFTEEIKSCSHEGE